MKLQNIVLQYVSKKAERLAKQKETDKLKEEEEALKTAIIACLRGADLKPLGANASNVTLSTKMKPTVADWPKLYGFIYKHEAIDLLQKRLTESAVQLRWDESIVIPGVDKFPVYDISVKGVTP